MKNHFIKNLLLVPSVLLAWTVNTYGQDSTAASYESLSLKDLLNVKIVTVSKKSEFLFDAPLSASVVTRAEIKRSGCTSIMEALRLVPGFIIREQTNGNYEIHLRGMDNVPPNAAFDITSSTTLVMIDNRPIYNYFRGGTFWETLPIDLNDVEKIEVVRGPAAALYGPNAVNGVINIITRQPEKNGFYAFVKAQQGSYHTNINNASLGYRTDKWNAIVSGNYQRRERTQTSYYEYYRAKWIDQPNDFIDFRGDTVENIGVGYPHTNLAMHKYASNIFLRYHPGSKINFDLSAGIQNSMVQKVSTENEITPLSTSASQSKYFDFRANIKGFSTQLSYNKGTQQTEFEPGNKYDFNTLDANIEYNYSIGNLSLKPGLSYRNAVYDDTNYSDTANKTGVFNAKGKITTRSASLRGEYSLFEEKLRLVAGIMASKFNYPDTTYISYQFAATYKLHENHLIRAVFSRAPRSSAIFDTYVDQRLAYFPSGFRKFTLFTLVGNKNLKLLTADLMEFGYRGKINSKLTIDAELFDIKAKNYNALIFNRPFIRLAGTDTIQVMPLKSTNLPLKLSQQGFTISLTYSMNKFQVRPFVTLQQTWIKDYAPYINTPDARGATATTNIYSGIGTRKKLESTPTIYGGASVNFIPDPKVNLNMSAYYYSSQTYYHLSHIIINDGIRGIDHIKGKFILNTSVSYEPVKGFHLFLSGKNILNIKSREFFGADNVPGMFLGGFSYEL